MKKTEPSDEQEDEMAKLRLAIEQARSEAAYAERRYMAVDPENRLIAYPLECDWEEALRKLEKAKAELAFREERLAQTPPDGSQS